MGIVTTEISENKAELKKMKMKYGKTQLFLHNELKLTDELYTERTQHVTRRKVSMLIVTRKATGFEISAA